MLQRDREFSGAEFNPPSREEERRLNEIKAQNSKRVLEKVVQRDDACRSAFYEAYTERNGQRPDFGADFRTFVPNGAAIKELMRPDDIYDVDHNMRVMEALSDVDPETGKFRDQAKAAEAIKDARDELMSEMREIAPETLDAGDFYAMREKYPQLEALYGRFQAISELTKPGGALDDAGLRQVFPTAQEHKEFAVSGQFVMGVCDRTRAQLLADNRYVSSPNLDRESGLTGNDARAEATRSAESRLKGATTLAGLRGRMEEAGELRDDPRLGEQREPVSRQELERGRPERQTGASRRRQPEAPAAAMAADAGRARQ
jgi:hypothetical protein